MSRRSYIYFGSAAVAIGLTIWLAVPELVEWSAGRWLKDRLARHGVDWNRLEFSWSGHATIRGLNADIPGDGDSVQIGSFRVRASARAGEVTVGIPWDILWSGSNSTSNPGSASMRLDAVRLQGVSVEIESQPATKGDSEHVSGASNVTADSALSMLSSRVADVSHLISERLPTAESLTASDLALTLRFDDHRLGEMSGRFSLDVGAGSIGGDGTWSVYPNGFGATETIAGDWSFDGSRRREQLWQGEMTGVVTSGSPELQALGLSSNGLFWEYTQINSDRCATDRFRAGLRAPRVTALPGFAYRANTSGTILHVANPKCAGRTPTRMTLFADSPVVEIRGATSSDAPTANEIDSPASVSSLRTGIRDVLDRVQATQLADVVHLNVHGARVVSENSSIESNRATVVHNLQIESDDAAVRISGESGDGEFHFEVTTADRSLFPAEAHWHLAGVELSRLGHIVHRLIGAVGPSFPAIEQAARSLSGQLDSTGWLLVTENPISPIFRRGDDLAMGRVRLQLNQGWIDIAGLADSKIGPLHTDLDLSIRTPRWPPRIEVSTTGPESPAATVGTPSAEVPFGFNFRLNDPAFAGTGETARLKLSIPDTSCRRGFEAIPDALWGAYQNANLTGAAAPRITAQYTIGEPRSFEIDVEGWPGDCRVVKLRARRSAWPPVQIRTPKGDYRQPGDATLSGVGWTQEPFALRVTEGVSDDATVVVGPGSSQYASLGSLPEPVPAAAYLSEEVAFWRDGVVNLHLLERAVRMNLEERRFVYGGSTITQQLVKNLFLSRDKTLARKIREALIGWRMLDSISKKRVLELYLNCIEFGPDIYGIVPAAHHYFQRNPSKLTLKQAVFLAIIKPAPWYGERFRLRGSTPKKHWWRERMGEIIARLVIHDVISKKRALKARPFVLKWNDDGEWVKTPHRETEEPTFRATLNAADDDGD